MGAGSTPPSGRVIITTDVEADEGRLALAGELDLACAADVERAIEGLERTGVKRIVVDLSQLAFIDSTGLRLLIQADARARDNARELLLIPGNEAVQRVFELTRTVEVLSFVPRDAA